MACELGQEAASRVRPPAIASGSVVGSASCTSSAEQVVGTTSN